MSKDKIRDLALEFCNLPWKRIGWYYQQFLKFSYAASLDDDAAVVDGDTVPLKRLKLKTDDGKYIFNIKSKHHAPYFDLIEDILPQIDMHRCC